MKDILKRGIAAFIADSKHRREVRHMFLCPFCRDRGKNYLWIERPRFSIDRYSRSRVKAVVRCMNCGMEIVAMRDSHSANWKWNERG